MEQLEQNEQRTKDAEVPLSKLQQRVESLERKWAEF